MIYRKKPVEIEAVQWGPPLAEVPQWLSEALDGVPTTPGKIMRMGDSLHIGTLEGITVASPGDYIIRGVKGELYACKPDIFDLTYEKVS